MNYIYYILIKKMKIKQKKRYNNIDKEIRDEKLKCTGCILFVCVIVLILLLV